MKDYWAQKSIKAYFTTKLANEFFACCLEQQDNKIAPGKILDAGCGYGRNITLFSGSEYEKFAFDPSEESIIYTAKRFDTITVLNVAIQDKPFSNQRFKVIMCDGVLHQMLSIQAFNSALDYFAHIAEYGCIMLLSVFTDAVVPGQAVYLGNGIWRNNADLPMLLCSAEKIISSVLAKGFLLLAKQEKQFVLQEGLRSNLECVFKKE
jgi:2-polyprenyl-3-methyl-5-hydroxy-6-metoxy-1,4-benzoquinol methylase